MADDDPKQTHFQGCPYVQITFKPAGEKKERTLWAIKLAAGKYMRAANGGGEWTDPKAAMHTVRKELILTGDEVVERPAAVNLTYGEMEVLDGTSTSNQEDA